MPDLPPFRSVAAATENFVAGLAEPAPRRVEAKVWSRDGMPLLCAVETVLGATLSRRTAQELVWQSGAPAAGGHVLRLQAYGADNTLVAAVVHEFAG